MPILWGLKPILERTSPIIHVPVDFPNVGSRRGFLYDVIKAAGLKTRAYAIESLLIRAEEALFQVALKERLWLHHHGATEQADHWLVTIHEARDLWSKSRLERTSNSRSRVSRKPSEYLRTNSRQVNLQSMWDCAGYFTYVNETSGAWQPPPVQHKSASSSAACSLSSNMEAPAVSEDPVPLPMHVDQFDFVLETMEKLSGESKRYVSVKSVADFAALPHAEVLESLQTGELWDMFVQDHSDTDLWRLTDSYAMMSL